MPFLIGAFAIPIFGAIIDKIGIKSIFIAASSMLLIIAHLFLAYLPQATTDTNYRFIYAPIVFGLCYSIYAPSLWPSVPYTVNK